MGRNSGLNIHLCAFGGYIPWLPYSPSVNNDLVAKPSGTQYSLVRNCCVKLNHSIYIFSILQSNYIVYTGKKSQVSTDSQLNRISRGKLPKPSWRHFQHVIPSIQMRSGCALYSSLHSECLSCGTSLAKISIKGSSATYSRRRRKRLLCVSCPGNHNRNTLVLLNCEGETEFPLKIRMQKFLCPADLMENMVLKLVSNEVRALIAPFFCFFLL